MVYLNGMLHSTSQRGNGVSIREPYRQQEITPAFPALEATLKFHVPPQPGSTDVTCGGNLFDVIMLVCQISGRTTGSRINK